MSSCVPYLQEVVEPVLRPLLLRAVDERPSDFQAWLAVQLRAEVESASEKASQKDKEDTAGPSEFSLKYYEKLRRVQTKMQPKLTAGQYNINSNAPPYKYGNFSSRDFFGFGVVASKENADLARRRRIWRLFSATKSTTKNRERDLVYQICDM